MFVPHPRQMGPQFTSTADLRNASTPRTVRSWLFFREAPAPEFGDSLKGVQEFKAWETPINLRLSTYTFQCTRAFAQSL